MPRMTPLDARICCPVTRAILRVFISMRLDRVTSLVKRLLFDIVQVARTDLAISVRISLVAMRATHTTAMSSYSIVMEAGVS